MENSKSFFSSSLMPNSSCSQDLKPSKSFPELIFFHVGDKSSEISNRGVAQMGFQMFQCFYEQVFDIFELPPLTEQPRVDLYSDGTFSINWWGEILYCKNNDEFLDHLALLNDRFKGKAHKNFKEKEQQVYEKFRVKIEEVRNKLIRPSITISEEETRQLFQEKEVKIQEQEKQIQKLLKENQEKQANLRTEKENLTQELEESRKREEAKIKEKEEKRFIQAQQMQVQELKIQEQEKKIQKLLKENQDQEENQEEADKNYRTEQEKLSQEIEESRKRQEAKTKEIEEQNFIQTQQMQIKEKQIQEQEKKIQKLLKENLEQQVNFEEADKNYRAEKEQITKEIEELRSHLPKKKTGLGEEEKRKDQEEQKLIQKEQKQKAEEEKKAAKQKGAREQKKEKHRLAINNLLDEYGWISDSSFATLRARREYIRAHFSKSLQRCRHSTDKVKWYENCGKNKDAAILVTKMAGRGRGRFVHLQCFFATIAQDLGREDVYKVDKQDMLESLDTLLDHWD